MSVKYEVLDNCPDYDCQVDIGAPLAGRIGQRVPDEVSFWTAACYI
jgi:hypothetical protein